MRKRKTAYWIKMLFAALFLWGASSGHTQVQTSPKVLVITLEEAIQIAIDRSYSIQNIQQMVIAAERNLWAAKAGYRTNIQSSLYTPIYDEGFKLIEVVEGNPVAKQYRSYNLRGILDVIQPMPWIPLGGANLTFRSEAYQLSSWSPSSLDPDIELKSKQFFTSLSAILEKPLFTINELSLGLKQAQLNYERQSRVYKRSELDLVYQVTNSFYGLYRRLQQHEINREIVTRQEDIHRTTLNKFQAGLIAEVDAMQAEVDLLQYQNDLKASQGALQEQESSFKQLIGLALDDSIRVLTNLELKPLVIDQEKAVGLALQHRSELAEKRIDIEDQKINIKQIDAQVSIKGNLTGYYTFSGFSNASMPFETLTQDLLESSWEVLKKTPNRGISFQLEIPIWDWGKNRAQVQSAKANLKQEELALNDLKRTVEREVRDVVRSVYEAYDRVQLLTKSKDVSQKSYDISIQRFANGDITSVELARASDQLNNAKIQYLSAYIEYQMALADLKRKTLYDFEKDQSLVE